MVALEQMPDEAWEILLAAVLETGPAHRLIIAAKTLGGSMHVTAGNKQWTVDRHEAPEFKAAIDYLLRQGLIVLVPRKGYGVTDAGCRVVQSAESPQ